MAASLRIDPMERWVFIGEWFRVKLFFFLKFLTKLAFLTGFATIIFFCSSKSGFIFLSFIDSCVVESRMLG